MTDAKSRVERVPDAEHVAEEPILPDEVALVEAHLLDLLKLMAEEPEEE